MRGKKMLVILPLLVLALIMSACHNDTYKARRAAAVQTSDPVAEAAEQSYLDKEQENALAVEAYSEINAAHEILDKMVTDIYDAWHWAIYEAKDGKCTLPLLAKESKRPVNELKRGYAYIAHESTWAELTIGDRQKLINSAESDFIKLLNSGFSRFSACVLTIKGIYLENGSYDEATEHLKAAGKALEQLHDQFPNSAAYEPLKEYYINETAMAGYCQSPNGSFEQARTTVNNYRNAARENAAEIDLLVKN